MSSEVEYDIADELNGFANLIDSQVESGSPEEMVVSTVERGNEVYRQAEKVYEDEVSEELDVNAKVDKTLEEMGYSDSEESFRYTEGLLSEGGEVELEDASGVEAMLSAQQNYIESVFRAKETYGDSIPAVE